MTIDSEPRVGQPSAEAVRTTKTGGGTPSKPLAPGLRPGPPTWMQQSVLTAVAGGIIGYLVGHWLGNLIASNYSQVQGSGQNDVAISLALAFMVLGWLGGVGALNYPLVKIIGREPLPDIPKQSWTRYFRFTLDHKVVGIQYLVAVFTFLFTGGLLAMGIRTELLTPASHFFGPGTYIDIVGEHGTIMMMMASSVVIGPLGNYLVPLMIGSRRTAFPRVEAASLWVFCAGYFVILTALPFGGFPTGWTGYASLQTEGAGGMDSYLIGFGVIGLGMILAGFNLLVTIIHFRAPGMSWGRLPIFVWSILATAALLTLATPTLVAAGLFGILDRTAETAFFVNEHGGSSFLWENLFWFFGHPEVYIMALPGFGIVAELLPVFCRKPLFGYRVAAAGMLGVALLSFFVWQHHLFQSGIDPDMRPLFMLTTELISIPTGFIYLVGLGTLWKAKIRMDVPMLFVLRGVLQLPDRRRHRGVPVGRTRRRHRPRQLLRYGPLPLHHHGRVDLCLLRRRLLLDSQDNRTDYGPSLGQDPLLDHVRLLQLDLFPLVHRGPAGPTPPGLRVRQQPAGLERLLLRQRLPVWVRRS